MDAAQPILFWLIAAVTGLSAIGAVVAQNIVRSATWLLFTLAGSAGVFFLLGADLVGAVQILVYVGGTLVLVIFGVMLTAQGPFINIKATSAEWAISAIVGLLLLSVLVVCVGWLQFAGPPQFRPETAGQQIRPVETVTEFAPKKDELDKNVQTSHYSQTIGQGFLGVGVGPAHREGAGVVRINYLLPFELVSVHLLVVLIGAAYLGRAKRRRKEIVP